MPGKLEQIQLDTRGLPWPRHAAQKQSKSNTSPEKDGQNEAGNEMHQQQQ